MRSTLIIIVILAGCGDVSTAAAPSRPSGPMENPEPAPSEPKPAEPEALETPCDEAIAIGERFYFYAEREAPEWDFDAFNCYESGKPFEAPTCIPATQYAIEDGVVRILCGEWQSGDEGSYQADFVRIEPLGMDDTGTSAGER
jgi:hypothetical protein